MSVRMPRHRCCRVGEDIGCIKMLLLYVGFEVTFEVLREVGTPGMGWGLSSPKCRLAPNRKIYWSRISVIVSAVKICKQRLQTVSALKIHYRGFARGPH